MAIEIRAISPDDEQALGLLRQSDELMNALYPAESNHLEGPDVLNKPNVLFVGAFEGAELVGCGAVKILDDDGVYGEFKRVFVVPARRGKRISVKIMKHLFEHLRAAGVTVARLETGVKQPEALGLYRKLGFAECPPFGAYGADPVSVFMEKRLNGEGKGD